MPLADDDGPERPWVTKATETLRPIIADMLRALKRRYPALPDNEIDEILETELSLAIYEMLSNRPSLTLDICQEALARVERLCAERSGRPTS